MQLPRPAALAPRLLVLEIVAALSEATEACYQPKGTRLQLARRLRQYQDLHAALSTEAARYMLAHKREYLASHSLICKGPSTRQPKAGTTVRPRSRGRTRDRGQTGGAR